MPTPSLPLRTCRLPSCGGKFAPRHRLSAYCSPECGKKALSLQLKALAERRKKENRKKLKDKKCETCGASFTPRNSDHKYCPNPQCAAAGVLRAIERQRQRRAEAKRLS